MFSKVPTHHFVNQHAMQPPYPEGIETAVVGMGCFWGAERLFWRQAGVYLTAVGYAGGTTPDPDYKAVCTGKTGHAEVVKIWFFPEVVSYPALLRLFWESHDPTQGMRQGNDIGTQYRSVLYTFSPQQQEQALHSRDVFQQSLHAAGLQKTITTGIMPAPVFYYAEPYHQQYLAKNPDGYCGLKGLGVSCPE
ncbi:peptide-methionine (S)-S-oxide reductase MsrA [Candidatus Woesearchaeota archaeon]|nr:peptide-methionine (S)-S-oxide reductase MsrA [Candidatus Woesearchaeota archaeon]